MKYIYTVNTGYIYISEQKHLKETTLNTISFAISILT